MKSTPLPKGGRCAATPWRSGARKFVAVYAALALALGSGGVLSFPSSTFAEENPEGAQFEAVNGEAMPGGSEMADGGLSSDGLLAADGGPVDGAIASGAESGTGGASLDAAANASSGALLALDVTYRYEAESYTIEVAVQGGASIAGGASARSTDPALVEAEH